MTKPNPEGADLIAFMRGLRLDPNQVALFCRRVDAPSFDRAFRSVAFRLPRGLTAARLYELAQGNTIDRARVLEAITLAALQQWTPPQISAVGSVLVRDFAQLAGRLPYTRDLLPVGT